MKFLGRLRSILALLTLCLLVVAGLAYLRLGGGAELEHRATPPRFAFDVVETVADLDYPPGNIAVAPDGRVFFTLHPDGHPPTKVMMLGSDGPEPWPDLAWQQESDALPSFQTVLALRIDRQNRLWALDHADFGRGQPRLLAFDLDSRELVERFDFPPDIAGLGSMLNDLQVSRDGKAVFIAETSPLLLTPALIVYDVEQRRARRLLEGHPSVATEKLVIRTPRRAMRILGLFDLRIPVDSIALDREGKWLYYGAVTGGTLWRVAAADLLDPALEPDQLAARVEAWAAKSLSDGLTSDDDGNIYLSDMEHRAVHILKPDRSLETLVTDARLRWPDGFSFGPDGWLYVTCSALDDVLFQGKEAVAASRPFQIFRFRPGPSAAAGH